MKKEEIRKIIKEIEEKQAVSKPEKAKWLEYDKQIAMSILRRTKERS